MSNPMTSPIRDIDAARRALVAERRAFQIAIGLAFWWVHTPQGDEFWSGEYEAGRLSPEGRTALEAMIAEYEAELPEEAGAADAASTADTAKPLQKRVLEWAVACFGETIPFDKTERIDRFVEEALEFGQSLGWTKDRAHALVDYVFGRPWGEPAQEAGGTIVTLAALCEVAGIDMLAAGETELARVWTKIDKIRAKQAAKPVGSALPAAAPPADDPVKAEMLAALRLVCDMVDRPPDPNCSCHIAPPCGDCVDYGGLREMFAAVDAAVARAEGRS